jgi:hypothetical protein
MSIGFKWAVVCRIRRKSHTSQPKPCKRIMSIDVVPIVKPFNVAAKNALIAAHQTMAIAVRLKWRRYR